MRLIIKTAEDLAAATRQCRQERLRHAIDTHVEEQAKALGYNRAAHLAGYATSTVPDWQAEAQAFVAWRDQVWQAAFAMTERLERADTPDTGRLIAALPDWQG